VRAVSTSNGALGKGTTLIPTVKFLRRHRDRAEPLMAPHLRPYLTRRILPGSWYPEADLMALLQVLLQLIPGDRRATWEMFGEEAAEAHATVHYEGFIRNGPGRLLANYDALWHLQHDSGRWEVTLEGDVAADVHLFDFPAGMPEYGALMTGYFRRMLEKCGAVDPQSQLVACDATSGHWRLRWDR
jgi:uncharacterized protein (TIGR02265 family)